MWTPTPTRQHAARSTIFASNVNLATFISSTWLASSHYRLPRCLFGSWELHLNMHYMLFAVSTRTSQELNHLVSSTKLLIWMSGFNNPTPNQLSKVSHPTIQPTEWSVHLTQLVGCWVIETQQNHPKILYSIPTAGHQPSNDQRREFVAHPGSLPIIKRLQCSCINQVREAYKWPDDRTKYRSGMIVFVWFQ